MEHVDLYEAAGGLPVCRQLSEAFYARVQRDPVLRPLFPGKSMRCAVEAFTAFLAQFLGGPSADAQERWWLSLRESHLRFEIGARERQAWMKNMVEALGEVPVDETVRRALRNLFERSSAYLVNSGPPVTDAMGGDPPEDGICGAIAKRWDEQRMLDDLVAAIRAGDGGRGIELAESPALRARFGRDRAVFAHVLGLMIGSGTDAFLEYAERELLAEPALGGMHNRHGRTLLHEASAHGNLRMVELLLRLGADANVRTAGGHTPLYCLANECNVQGGGAIVRTLVQAGAQVNSGNGAKRSTALHMAARRGNAEIAGALLDCGADINARDIDGVTSLQRAKNCRKGEVALLLAARDT